MVSTRTRGRKRANSSPPKELPKKSRKGRGKKGKQATKKSEVEPIEEKPVEDQEVEEPAEAEEDKSEAATAPPVPEEEKKDTVKEGEQGGEEKKEEESTFDRDKAIEQVNQLLRQVATPKGLSVGCDAKEMSEDVAATAKDKTNRGHDPNTRRLYMQLKELRTTEVEQLLKDARETAATKERAQSDLIQELTAEVMRLKGEKESQSDGKIEWKKEYIRLKAKAEELRNEVKELRNEKSENSSAAGNMTSAHELERLSNICKFYQELTALRVEIKDTKGVCIATNKIRRKAVRFEIEFCEDEKKQACFRFTPTANIAMLPKSLSQSKVFKHQDAQKLLSRVWESLDQE